MIFVSKSHRRSVRLYAHPHEAHEFAIADRLVRLVDGRRTVGCAAIAEARIPASVVVPALVSEPQDALGGTARTLKEV